MNSKDERATSRDEVVDYDQTVKAILAFAALVVHDGVACRSGAEFGVGRRMSTSANNPIQPSSEITPDLVAQKSATYGVAAEAKKSLDRDESHWERHINQLRKYDDSLLGWWTEDETIKRSDAVMLVHHSRSRPFTRVLAQAANADPEAVGPNSCVVEFINSLETASYYFFRLEYGNIGDSELASRLADGVQIPLDEVLRSFPNVRYYDSEPPLPRLLTDLWTDVLPAMAADSEYDDDLKAYRVYASVKAVTSELQRAYGSKTLRMDSRSAEFPRQIWVKNAFERFCAYGLATPPSNGSDVFEIHYRPFRKDVLERFIGLGLDRKRTQATGREDGIKEDTLFPELGASEIAI